MKIAQIVCTFRPHKAGIGEVAYYYADGLAQLGHEVHVFTPASKYVMNKPIVEKQFHVHYMPSHLERGHAAIMKGLTEQLKDFDVIHLHYPFFGAAIPVWLNIMWQRFRFRRGKQRQVPRFIITYHMDVRLPGMLKNPVALYQRMIMPLILRSADKVIVSSIDYIRCSAAGSFYKKNIRKFLELPFAADEMFQPKEHISANLVKKYQLKTDLPALLFVGGLDAAHYFKGLHVLLEATELIERDFQVLVVGKGELREEYEKKAQELGIQNRIQFLGFVPDEELVSLYQFAQACVLPSTTKNEAFGIVLLQAMACGRPIIASNLPGVRTVVHDKYNGFAVPPKNPYLLAEKIEKILFNEKLQREFGQNGLKLIQKKYNWKTIIANLEKLYRES
jgi:glycosyltransferase involved in cell wall biosynthesis